jgi:hypothetical protein
MGSGGEAGPVRLLSQIQLCRYLQSYRRSSEWNLQRYRKVVLLAPSVLQSCLLIIVTGRLTV